MWVIVGILGIIVLGVIVLVLWLLSRPDEVQPIDNSYGQITCCNTNKPCIKDTLYTYWNNCSDCPCHKEQYDNKLTT